MPGVITCPGFGDGDAVGIGIPGVWICGEAAGVGEAAGICMSGVITCGVGEGLGLVTCLDGARRARGAGFFPRAARLGLGLGFAAGLGITCPSCCGNTLLLSAKIKRSALSVRNAIFKLLGRFMVPPKFGSPRRTLLFLEQLNDMDNGTTQADACRHHHECDIRKVLNAETADENITRRVCTRWSMRSRT